MLCVFGAINGKAQEPKIDSLENVLRLHTAEDTVRVNLLLKIGLAKNSTTPENTLPYATQALELSEKLGYLKGKAEGLRLTGLSYRNLNKPLALEYFHKALKVAQEANLKREMAKCYSHCGIIYKNMGKTTEAFEYYHKAIAIADEINDKFSKATSLLNISVAYSGIGNYQKAIEGNLEALKLFEELNNKKSVAIILNNLGNIYEFMGNYPLALEYYYKSLNINEALNDINGTINNLIRFATIYLLQANYDQALLEIQKALKIAIEHNQQRKISICYLTIGEIYSKTKNPEALANFEKALTIAEELNNVTEILNISSKTGDYYLAHGDNQKALEFFQKAMKIAQEIDRKRVICELSSKIGGIYLNQRKYADALKYSQRSLEIANELKLLILQRDNNYLLSEIYAATNDCTKAYKNLKIYNNLNDSVLKKDNIKRIVELEYSYKYQKEKQANELEQQKKDTIQATKRRQQSTTIILLGVCFILMSFLTIYVYRLYRFKHQTNMLLTKQKDEIKDLNEEQMTLIEELKQSNEHLYYAKQEIEAKENLLAQITNNIPVSISLLNRELEYEFVNDSYAKTFNWQKDEMIGKTAKDVLADYTFNNAIPNLLKTLDGKTVTFENSLQTVDDQQQILQTTYIPYYFHDGIQGILVSSVDITERKKLEQAIAASEEKLRLIIKNSNDIIVLVNDKGEQFFISDVAQKNTGYTVEELFGQIENVIYPDDLEIVYQHWNRVMSDVSKPDTIQYRHKHKDKGYVWFEAVAQNFLDHPSINAVVANIRDITERKNIELVLKASEAEKARLMALEIERVNRELETNQKSMAAATLKLIQNSERDADTINRLAEIENNTNAEGKHSIRSLITDYKRLSYNSNWDEFEILFEKVHSSFYERLNDLYPDLTANERKICAFLKLNMSSKDIANITFQSDEALKKARLRLRQKLGIDRETNLVVFLQNI
jgi:PAS domain S-box-containing protein